MQIIKRQSSQANVAVIVSGPKVSLFVWRLVNTNCIPKAKHHWLLLIIFVEIQSVYLGLL
jgi:hypothetical protein